MFELISKWPVVLQILAVVAAFNVSLSGIKAGLDMIQDKTQTDIDNKADNALGKLIAFINKIFDLVGYNPEHK